MARGQLLIPRKVSMKRHLTLAAIAIALGIVGWRQSPGVYADGSVPTTFEQAAPAVDTASGTVEESDEADLSDADEPVTEEAADTQNSEPAVAPSADDDEPLAVDEEPAAVEPGAAVSTDGHADENGTDSASSDPPVRISDEGTEIEVIRERYPNRAVKIEREVTQDADGNYVNHGSWKMWDAQGSLMVEGQYQYDHRIGVWNRWYRTAEIELLKAVPYNSFHGPFISQASFDLGRLNGKWTIYDSHQHKISEWEFVDGERHGNFTWWFPTGQKMRECHYEQW